LDKCNECGEKVAWENHVNDTNCDAIGHIPYDILFDHFAIAIVSPKEDIFRVPTNEESDLLRHYWDGDEYIPMEE
jgi:hypothetical protein